MVQEGVGNHSFGESGALSVESLATKRHRKTGLGLIFMLAHQAGRAGPQGRERAGTSLSYGANWWGGTGSACTGAEAGLCRTHSVTFHIQFCLPFLCM